MDEDIRTSEYLKIIGVSEHRWQRLQTTMRPDIETTTLSDVENPEPHLRHSLGGLMRKNGKRECRRRSRLTERRHTFKGSEYMYVPL